VPSIDGMVEACADLYTSLLLQMLCWGIDETLAELFARHPLADDFGGNPMDRFRGVIDGRAYGRNQTPRSMGLYGGRYTIEFRPVKFA
jgi:hypothetical protein